MAPFPPECSSSEAAEVDEKVSEEDTTSVNIKAVTETEVTLSPPVKSGDFHENVTIYLTTDNDKTKNEPKPSDVIAVTVDKTAENEVTNGVEAEKEAEEEDGEEISYYEEEYSEDEEHAAATSYANKDSSACYSSNGIADKESHVNGEGPIDSTSCQEMQEDIAVIGEVVNKEENESLEQIVMDAAEKADIVLQHICEKDEDLKIILNENSHAHENEESDLGVRLRDKKTEEESKTRRRSTFLTELESEDDLSVQENTISKDCSIALNEKGFDDNDVKDVTLEDGTEISEVLDKANVIQEIGEIQDVNDQATNVDDEFSQSKEAKDVEEIVLETNNSYESQAQHDEDKTDEILKETNAAKAKDLGNERYTSVSDSIQENGIQPVGEHFESYETNGSELIDNQPIEQHEEAKYDETPNFQTGDVVTIESETEDLPDDSVVEDDASEISEIPCKPANDILAAVESFLDTKIDMDRILSEKANMKDKGSDLAENELIVNDKHNDKLTPKEEEASKVQEKEVCETTECASDQKNLANEDEEIVLPRIEKEEIEEKIAREFILPPPTLNHGFGLNDEFINVMLAALALFIALVLFN